jgi:hypothetical protein
MGGRFGKYGDFKRKVRIRQSRLFKRDVERVRQTSRRLKKDKRFKIQGLGKPKVSIEIRPDVLPQQSGGGTGHSPISAKLFCKHSQVTFMPYRVVLKDERRTY